MTIEGFHAGAPNLCSVCVDERVGGDYSGRLYHYYSPQPVAVRDPGEILYQIERLCDWLNYPEKTEQTRCFSTHRRRIGSRAAGKRMERKVANEQLANQKGKMATFVVHVMYRQNATWQGSVTWAETGQKANFRSALELIKLMDSAVEDSLQEPPQESGPNDTLSSNEKDPVREEADHEI